MIYTDKVMWTAAKEHVLVKDIGKHLVWHPDPSKFAQTIDMSASSNELQLPCTTLAWTKIVYVLGQGRQSRFLDAELRNETDYLFGSVIVLGDGACL